MEPLSVSQVSEMVRAAVRSEPSLRDIAVRGEVTGYSPKKHVYFSLKDESSTLRCVIWASRMADAGCLPLANGQKVVAWGCMTAYGGNSTYQLDVSRVAPEGQGELYARFLALKKRLYDEGLFAPGHKKPMPAFPETVGIITSGKGAALQDMAKVLMSGPGIEVVTFDARVQGEGAAESLADGIRALDGKADVIIIGRGGGPMEELWAFNDEGLARAIAACGTPVISAVGHEVDEVLSDSAADIRASTPTAAAEMVVKARQAAIDEMTGLAESVRALATDKARGARQALDMFDMEMWRRLLSHRVESSGDALLALRSGLSSAAELRLSGARAALSGCDSALRTTWVAAMAENGLAALYQDGARVRSAAGFRKGSFEALMRDGRISGEVSMIEV